MDQLTHSEKIMLRLSSRYFAITSTKVRLSNFPLSSSQSDFIGSNRQHKDSVFHPAIDDQKEDWKS